MRKTPRTAGLTKRNVSVDGKRVLVITLDNGRVPEYCREQLYEFILQSPFSVLVHSRGVYIGSGRNT